MSRKPGENALVALAAESSARLRLIAANRKTWAGKTQGLIQPTGSDQCQRIKSMAEGSARSHRFPIRGESPMNYRLPASRSDACACRSA
jgi:hypothetical protein